MRIVYILQSLPYPSQRYIGLTEDFDARLDHHNAGRSPHTSKFKPLRVVVSIRFEDDRRAIDFEKYLKSGSGFAFSKRHFG